MEPVRIIYGAKSNDTKLEYAYQYMSEFILSLSNKLYSRECIYPDNLINLINNDIQIDQYQLKSIHALALIFEGLNIDNVENERILDHLPLDIFKEIILKCNPSILIRMFILVDYSFTRFYNALLIQCIPLWVKIKQYKRIPKWNKILHYFIDYSNEYHNKDSPFIPLAHRIITTILDNIPSKILEPNIKIIGWNTRKNVLATDNMYESIKVYQLYHTIIHIMYAKNYQLLQLCISHPAFQKHDNKYNIIELWRRDTYRDMFFNDKHGSYETATYAAHGFAFRYNYLHHCCYLPYAIETGDLEIIKIIFPYHCNYDGTMNHKHGRLCLLHDNVFEFFNDVIDHGKLILNIIKPSCKYKETEYYDHENELGDYTEYAFSKLLTIFNSIDRSGQNDGNASLILKILIHAYNNYRDNQYETPLSKMGNVRWDLVELLLNSVIKYNKPKKIPILPRAIVYIVVKSPFFTGNGTNKNTKHGLINYFHETVTTHNYEMFKIFLNKDIIDLDGIFDLYIKTIKPFYAAKSIPEDLYYIGEEILTNHKTIRIIDNKQKHMIQYMLDRGRLKKVGI
jgi:hypothetical protein